MNILYNQSQLKRTLILGILFFSLGIASLFTPNRSLGGFLGIGLLYVIIYFVQKNRPYVRITPDHIIKDGFFPTKIAIDQITSVHYFAGDYVIKAADKKIVIDINTIDKESVGGLKHYFESYLTK